MTKLFSVYRKYLNSCMIGGIVLGIGFGLLLPELSTDTALIGELFLRSLKLLIVPIIVVSMLAGIINLDETSNLGRLGLKTVTYYMVTTGLAVIMGLLLVNLIAPGSGGTPLPMPDTVGDAAKTKGLTDVARNIIPTNIVGAAVDGNVLGLIFFCIFLGIALLKSNHSGLPAVKSCVMCCFEGLIWMVDVIMLIAPIGILSLVATLVADMVQQNTLAEVGTEILKYAATVAGGLFLHATIVLPSLLVLFRINPLNFFRAMFPAISTAFSTASSAATLPVTLEALEEDAKVPTKYASFVAPLGATINMDGTAMYEAVAVIFIANMYGVDLTLTQQFVVFLTATFSAIGAAGIPGAGVVMMTLVLKSVGLPVEGIALILPIDRALDMLRTSVNVWGDSIGAGIIAKWEGE